MKFVHIRRRDKEGKLLPNGGFTVAYEVVDAEHTQVKFAIAKCSKLDTYNRKRGAKIAAGRLASERHIPAVIYKGKDERPVDAVVNALYMVTDGLRLLPHNHAS